MGVSRLICAHFWLNALSRNRFLSSSSCLVLFSVALRLWLFLSRIPCFFFFSVVTVKVCFEKLFCNAATPPKSKKIRLNPSQVMIGAPKEGCSDQNWAENGVLDPSWLIFAFSGRPDFPSRGPQTLENKCFRTSGLKIGAPRKRENQPRRIQHPILGPAMIRIFISVSVAPRYIGIYGLQGPVVSNSDLMALWFSLFQV